MNACCREIPWHNHYKVIGFLIISWRTDTILPFVGIKSASMHINLTETIQHFPTVFNCRVKDSCQSVSVAYFRYIKDIMQCMGIYILSCL